METTHSRFIGRAPGPLSPPTITPVIPERSISPRSSSNGSIDRKQTIARSASAVPTMKRLSPAATSSQESRVLTDRCLVQARSKLYFDVLLVRAFWESNSPGIQQIKLSAEKYCGLAFVVVRHSVLILRYAASHRWSSSFPPPGFAAVSNYGKPKSDM